MKSLFGKQQHPPPQQDANELDGSDYERLFVDALARTGELGLPAPSFKPISARIITPAKMEKAATRVGRHLQNIQPQQIAAQCFAINSAVVDVIAEAFETPAYITIGNVAADGHWFYKVDTSYLKNLIANGITPGQGLKLHAWITLPSYEIIDITLPTTYAVVKGIPELIGGAMANHPTEIRGMVFEPLIIGGEFFRRIGGIADVFVL